MGQRPEEVEPDAADVLFARAQHEKSLILAGKCEIAFDSARDIVFDTKTKPPFHPNTLSFVAKDGQGGIVMQCRVRSAERGAFLRPMRATR